MKITSKQIQTMWEEHTKNDLRKEFAEVVAIYVGSSTSRLELVESLMKRAGSHRFTNEDERFLYFSRLNHDHLFGEPIPAQFTKVPAGSSFANSHDRNYALRSKL